MDNVIYSRVISDSREEMGASATLYLTEETNGYAIFLREGDKTYIVCYHAHAHRNRAVEEAVEMAQESVDTLKRRTLAMVFPFPTC